MAEKYYINEPDLTKTIWNANLNGACGILAMLYANGDFPGRLRAHQQAAQPDRQPDPRPGNLGRLPALDMLQGPCRNADLRDPATKWAAVVRYARCSSGTACLAGLGQRCRGALFFAGERQPTQRRLGPPEQQGIDAYLEDSTLAALSAGQLGALPAQISLPFAARSQPAAGDVALCLP